MVTAWTNWGATYSCAPQKVEHPESEEQIASVVKAAEASGLRVKVAGAGHSFTDIACTDGVLIRLDRYDRVLEVDEQTRRVTVQSGITLAALNEELAARGLALPNLGDITYQSAAGAISTATHGTGIRLGNLATQVAGLSLVTAGGGVLECSPEEDRETFDCARVSLGALGVISTITFQCVPAFNLAGINRPARLDEVLEGLDENVDGNDHYEFFWFPHTEICFTKTNNRTHGPPRPRGRMKAYLDDVLLENRLYGAVCRLGRARNAWIPSLNRFVARNLSPGKRVDASYRIFATPRLVRFAEMEYAIPRDNAAEAITEVRSFIEKSGLRINFPVEVRFVAPDDICLSPSHARETCYIAVHVFQRMDYQEYFSGVERIMDGFDGRPHWGKLHFQTADTLRARYPRWDEFARVRGGLDPSGRFANDYLNRVLGPGLAAAPSAVKLY